MTDFRQKFREFLALRKITQKQAADRLGMTQQSMSFMIDVRNNKEVRPSTITKVCAVFPEFRKYLDGKSRFNLGNEAAENFDRLMRENGYFKEKVEAYAQKKLLEYLEEKIKK
ncbi:MAG: helix-turn-helix transcriptional regulator [Bacteroidota bacterium]